MTTQGVHILTCRCTMQNDYRSVTHKNDYIDVTHKNDYRV